MLAARVAKAWIRRMSISVRGDTEEEGAGLATGLPEPDAVALTAAVDVATYCQYSSDSGQCTETRLTGAICITSLQNKYEGFWGTGPKVIHIGSSQPGLVQELERKALR
jgi:hypothetical protein